MGKKNINKPLSDGSVGRNKAKGLFQNGTYSVGEFHSVYIECEDLTEYEPALKLVGSWQEWERLKRDWPAFKNVYLKEWREELEVLFKSRAIKQIQSSAKKGNFNASRWIAESGFDKKSGAGRVSKAEKSRAAKEVAEASAETKAEQDRVLKLVEKG